jgi:hypothetical protein
VALTDLKYDDTTLSLYMPETTGVFDNAQRPSFVHGGNSLQERVIPVITLEHRSGAGGSQARYRVTVEPRGGVTDMHCLKIRLEPDDQATLVYIGPTELELSLRVPEAPEVAVELRSVRGGARLAGGAIVAPLNSDFELFFHLSGPTDARVLVEVYHPTAVADVLPCVAPDRYAVHAVNPREPTPHPNGPTPESMAPPDGHLRKSASAVKSTDPAPDVAAAPKPTPEPEWLRALPEGGIRRVFAHIAEHGTLSETDVAALLGAPRHLRTFALKFKEYAAKAPFDVRVDTVDNLRIYVREGTAP